MPAACRVGVVVVEPVGDGDDEPAKHERADGRDQGAGGDEASYVVTTASLGASSGIVLLVHTTTTSSVSSTRCVLGVLVASTVALACTVLWLLTMTAPMTGTTGMTGMGGEPSAAAAMVEMGQPAEGAVALSSVVAAVGVDVGQVVVSSCDAACIAEVGEGCTLAAGVTLTLMALLLGSRRDTFLGVLRRLEREGLVDRRPRWVHALWTVLSLSSLGVLRV